MTIEERLDQLEKEVKARNIQCQAMVKNIKKLIEKTLTQGQKIVALELMLKTALGKAPDMKDKSAFEEIFGEGGVFDGIFGGKKK